MARSTKIPFALLATWGLLIAALALGSCRGGTSTAPPVHLVLDMDFQPKLKAQAATHFDLWADGRAMRVPVKNTVARGSLDPQLMPNPAAPGKNADGSYIEKNPLPASMEVLQRGRERFDINCSPCHGYTARGGNKQFAHGMVGVRWPVTIPTFHASTAPGADNRVANLKDGEFFEVMSSPVGKGTMPSYAARVSVSDRWAIVHYIRALQDLGRQ